MFSSVVEEEEWALTVSASVGVEALDEGTKEGDKDGEDDDDAQCTHRALEMEVIEVGERGRLVEPLLAVDILEDAEEEDILL